MAREFRLPDLGEGIAEAQIIQVLVKEGETIEEDHSLFEVETDKAAVEIPSPFAGAVEKIHVKAGQTVNVGDVMVTFGDGESPTEAKARPERAQKTAAAETPAAASSGASTATAVAAPPKSARRTIAPAAPAVRKLARDLGVDIDRITGSGPGGRVTREDVQAAANGRSAPATAEHGAPSPAPTARPHVPAVPAPPTPRAPATLPPGQPGQDKWGRTRTVPLTQIRKTIAQHMTRSAFTAVHVAHMDFADVTELEALRQQYRDAHGGERRITAMAFIVKAVAMALRDHPVFNAAIDMEAGAIVYKEYVNVGIAVDTERGLVVPNVRNTERLGVGGIALELARIAENARTVQFSIDDLRGGTFTITNVGALGGTFSTPIINYPEVAILGLGQTRPMPVVRDGAVVVRSMLPVSFAFDHRIADGAQAARFCKDLFAYLERPVTLLI